MYAAFLGGMHLLAAAAPFTFSWSNFWMFMGAQRACVRDAAAGGEHPLLADLTSAPFELNTYQAPTLLRVR